MNKRYKVVISQSGKNDVKNKKRYIIQNFKYREYAENFSSRIKKAAEELTTILCHFPACRKGRRENIQ